MSYESAGMRATLANSAVQGRVYGNTARNQAKRKRVVNSELLPEFEELRSLAHDIKKHTIEHLDYYLELTERVVVAAGGKVCWARDADDACQYIIDLARRRGAHTLVKSKSMTTEEIRLNPKLEEAGLEPVETDLGEFIVQLAGDRPYHIVAPAMHMNRQDVADVFEKRLGVGREEVPEQQAAIARRVLRERFLAAGIGISGANFVVAETGAVVIVENEGNARLTTSAPPVHVAIGGIEKLVPRMADLGLFLNLLGRSATGQVLSVYTSILMGPRRQGEIDGPEEFHLVLLDNGRSRLLADRAKRESLYCIRCGACLNHCPVYRKVGGHNYPGAYSGPIGSILSPQYLGVAHDPWLPYASSLCGACGAVCPVKIDIPRILLELRSDVVEATGASALERWGFRMWAWAMQRPRLYEMGAAVAGAMWSLLGGRVRAPAPASRSFREQWRERTRA